MGKRGIYSGGRRYFPKRPCCQSLQDGEEDRDAWIPWQPGDQVLSALDAAGDAGVKVADLAEKLRVKGTNLHVWFGTTGKKNKAIKKVGKGHYRLQK